MRDKGSWIAMAGEDELPRHLVMFCGSDCGLCGAYQRFLAGDEGGLVNPETRYRCCWLPKSYPRGVDCPIRICCEEKGTRFCGECDQFDGCARIGAFYSQPGYDVLRERMLAQITRKE